MQLVSSLAHLLTQMQLLTSAPAKLVKRVRRQRSERLPRPIRPGHFDLVEHRRSADSNVHARIVRRAVAVRGIDSAVLSPTTRDDPDAGPVRLTAGLFDHAEERRLFYVALTRARKTVTIIADREKPSVFARELHENPAYGLVAKSGAGISAHQCRACGGRMLAQTSKKGRRYFACEHRSLCGETLPPCSACSSDLPVANKDKPGTLDCSCSASFSACPKCLDGWLVERTGKFGQFLGCVKYPDCRGSKKIPKTGRSDRKRRATRAKA